MLALEKCDIMSIMEFINNPICYKIGKCNFYNDGKIYRHVKNIFETRMQNINIKLIISL